MHAEQHLDKSITGRFTWAIALTASTLLAEVIGAIFTNSLALLSDAAHVFLDLFALVLSLVAIKLAAYPASDTRTFGWHRGEVFASFINGASVFLMSLGIFYEAVQRLAHPQAVNSVWMLIIAAIGLVTNLISASFLHAHSHDDLNVHSAFLHVIGDAAASVGVIVGGIIIYFTNWYIIDAVISIAIGFVIFWGAWRVLRDSTHILLEGVPRGLLVNDIAAAMQGVEGVNAVHHVNVWTICSHIRAFSGHIDIHPEHKRRQADVLRQLEQLLFEKFHITHTTLQVECTMCIQAENGEPPPIFKELRHRPRHQDADHEHGPGCSHHHGHSHDGHDH